MKIIKENSYQTPPTYEKLQGKLECFPIIFVIFIFLGGNDFPQSPSSPVMDVVHNRELTFLMLAGNALKKAVSRRINIKHRLVYEVIEEEQIVKIIDMWTHYEF